MIRNSHGLTHLDHSFPCSDFLNSVGREARDVAVLGVAVDQQLGDSFAGCRRKCNALAAVAAAFAEAWNAAYKADVRIAVGSAGRTPA